MTYKPKEVKKLEELTEKLKSQGDISQEEADLIYMLRKIYRTHDIVEKNRYLSLEKQYCNFLYLTYYYWDDPIHFDFRKTYLTAMSEAFREWYRTVTDFVSRGSLGNFAMTVPAPSFLEDRDEDEETKKQIELASEKLQETISFRKEDYSYPDNFLTLDIVPFRSESHDCKVSRYGLLLRSKRCFSDVSFLQKMARKLEKEDITLEESDMIYIIMKFIQSLYAEYFYCIGLEKIKKPIARLQKALSGWYRSVYEAVKEGRKGNFLYTIPIENYRYIGPSTIHYIKKSLEMLPEQFALAEFYRQPSVPDLAGVFLDEKNNLYSQRCNVVREVVDIDKYALFSDYLKISNLLEFIKAGESKKDRINHLIDGSQKINALAVEFEYLNKNKILPVCKLLNANSTTDFFIAYKKEDQEKVRRVLEIPYWKVKDVLPPVSWHPTREEFLSALEESVYIFSKIVGIYHDEEDDSWVDIER